MHRSTLPFWVRMILSEEPSGGSDDEEAPDQEVGVEEEDSEDAEEGDDEAGEDQLGDAGKQALDRMKQKWRAERDKRKALEAQLEGEKPEESPEDKSAEFMRRANTKILRSEIKAAAAGKLADPTDAYRFLNLDDFEVTDDGEVDEDEIAEAINGLVEKKPYLAAQPQGERRFKGSAGQGVRKGTGPKQLTEADLERMSAEQIEKARRSGQFDKVLGISRHL